MFRRAILPRLVFWLYRGLSATWRKQRREPAALTEHVDANQPFIVAIWHGDEIGLTSFSPFYNLCAMTSLSKDGELMDYVLRRLGFATARGSSSRGGSRALRGLIRLAREGWCPVIAVDGPRGPVHQAKPGILELARLTGLPVFPCAMACSRGITMSRSWDRTEVPLPFSRVLVQWGEPIVVQRHDNARSDAMTRRLDTAINDCMRRARASLDSR